LFDPITIGIFVINLALVYHVFRTGQSPLWIMALGLLSISGFVVGGLAILANFALWAAYVFFVILPGLWSSAPARRFADNVVNVADPGRAYREKQRQVATVGSADAKRALAEECIKMGRFADAVELYESAMAGPLGGHDTTLLKGLARAKMLSGDPSAPESCTRISDTGSIPLPTTHNITTAHPGTVSDSDGSSGDGSGSESGTSDGSVAGVCRLES